jgi:hypothetical protein
LNSTFDENATTIFMPPDIGQNTLTTKRANRLCKNLSALFINPKLLSLGFSRWWPEFAFLADLDA